MWHTLHDTGSPCRHETADERDSRPTQSTLHQRRDCMRADAGSHLVVDVRQEAPQFPGVLSLPSPRLLLVRPLLSMPGACRHTDLHVNHS